MDKTEHIIFFIGGHDAEMCEIKTILTRNGCQFYDNDLAWNTANLSAYKSELQNFPVDSIPVFIELKQDIPYPQNSIFIDHHGENSGFNVETSLEQIAKRIGVELDRRQQLICANDRGHIRGMLAIGASDEEVLDIRAYDRQSQGCSDFDCALGEEAIRNNLEEPFPGVAVVTSLTSKSAAIVDRLWNRYQSIVIKLPDNVLSASAPGTAISKLFKHYADLKRYNPDISFWYGGNLPSYGYFGSNYYDERIISMVAESTTPISQHVFLFPFRIVPWGTKDGSTVVLRDVYNKLIIDGWKYANFNPFDSADDYNNYVYFHEYLRDAIFESQSVDDLFDKKSEPNFVSCKLVKYSKGDFVLKLKNQEPYILEIAGISLRLFETGIAIFGFELKNRKYCHFNDIARINDYGRRIYPQFLTPGANDNSASIEAVKGTFLPDKVEIHIDGNHFIEQFDVDPFFRKKIATLGRDDGHYHQHIASYVLDIIGSNITETYKIEPVIDDRMFTLGWFCSDDMMARLTDRKDGEYSFETSEEWYRFIFLDGEGSMCPDEKFRKTLIDASTYRRWSSGQEGLTLFGVTRYSFMCLADSGAPPFLANHMSGIYRNIAEILLSQRASIITFSSQVAAISREIDQNADSELTAERVRKLHKNLIGFVNRLWFEEVTPQEQGIELYAMAMRNMNLKNHIAELKEEMSTLYEYVEMQYERKQNKSIANLTFFASLGIPLSIVFSFWGISTEFASKYIFFCVVTIMVSLIAGGIAWAKWRNS